MENQKIIEINKIIKKSLKKGLSISEKIYLEIDRKIKENDIDFLTIKNNKYYYTKIDDQIYYCSYSIKNKRIVNFFNKESFFKNKNGQWEYKKRKKLTQIQIRRKRHSIERAMERYGFHITDIDYDNIIIKINKDECLELMKEKSYVNKNEFFYFYKINYMSNDYIVLFSKKTQSIISFYHKSWIVQNEEGIWVKKDSKKKRKVIKKINNKKSHKIKTKKAKYSRKNELDYSDF